MRPFRSRLAAAIAMCGALALGATACGSDAPSSEASAGTGDAASANGKPETKNITFGVVPTVGYAPVFIADDRGFFAEEGLNVTPQVINPSTTVPSLVGGNLQIAGVTTIAYLISTNRGIGLHAVHEEERGTSGYASVIVPKDSPIQTYEDLVGKKVASPSEPGVFSLVIGDMLREEGLDDKSVEWTSVAIPDMTATMATGGIDAAGIPEPARSGALASGEFREVVDLFTGDYANYPIVIYSTTEEFAEDNPNTVAALSRALEKAAQLINKDESVVDEIMPGVMELPPKVIKAAAKPIWPTADDGPPNLELVARLIEEGGLFDGELTVPEIESGEG